jgi:hypothetical protein
MSKPLGPESGQCLYAGVPCSIIRSGTKRRLTRRERKWEREKTHRRRRHRWSRWPKVPFPKFFYTVNPEWLKDMGHFDAAWEWEKEKP